MEEMVKTLVAAPANAVLLLAGIAFLAVSVFGRITERLDPGPKGRILAGGLGAVLIVISLFLSTAGERQPTAQAPAATPTSQPSPATADAPTPSTAAPTEETTEVAAAPANQTPASATESYPVALAAGQVVKGEARTYTINRIELDRHGIDERALAITVRMQNDTDYPGNFWNDNFRLMVDGALTAPSGFLNELVDGHASKEGMVSFVLPRNAKDVALQIDQFGADAPGIAIVLPPQD